MRTDGHRVEVRVTWEPGDATRLTAEAVAQAAQGNIDCIVAGGGDGTINEVFADRAGERVHRLCLNPAAWCSSTRPRPTPPWCGFEAAAGAACAPFVLDGPMNATSFMAYLKRCLAPTLKRSDIVMMDSLPMHKVAGVREVIEAAGARLRYLPKIFTGSESDRAGVQQTQSPSTKSSRANHSASLA